MATFEQERHVELVPGAAESFVITNRMISALIPAELPHLSVFVVLVNDVTNPKADTLVRVAMISDLSLVPIGRDQGIAAPGPDGIQYLSATWEQGYPTLETGLDAAKAFRDRVNALITDWQSFNTSFSAPDPTPAIYTFPAMDTSTVTALIAAYKAAKQDRYQKQLAKADADDALAEAQADLTYKQGLVTTLGSIVSGAAQNVNEMTSLRTFLSTLQVAASVALTDPGWPSSSFKDALTAAVVTAATQITQASGFVTDAGTLSTAIVNYRNARQGEVNAAQTVLFNAVTDQATKATALASALALEASTLAAVLAVCPHFDPHSIPLVDG